jgi:hypothetical protein
MKTALMSELKAVSARNVEDFKKWLGKGQQLVSGREKTPVAVIVPIKEWERIQKQLAPAPVNSHMKFCACGSTHGDTHTNGCDGVER